MGKRSGTPARWNGFGPDDTKLQLCALAAIAFLFPVLLAAVFYPTPSVDLREHINWGLHFPLITWKHPPLQSWLAGLVALTGLRDAWVYVLAAQALNAVGLLYLVKAARNFIAAEAAPVVILAVCGSIVFFLSLSQLALNADMLQFPLWAGCLYHTLAALHANRWRDWLAAGAFAGLAMLTKYSSAVLIMSLLAAAAWVPSFRNVFGNPRLYIAIITAAAIFAFNVVPLLRHPDFMLYGAAYLHPGAPLLARLRALATLFGSLLGFGLPFLGWLAWLWWKRARGTKFELRSRGARFTLAAGVAMISILAALIVLGGLDYRARFTTPILALGALAVAGMLTVDQRTLVGGMHVALAAWLAAVLGSIMVALVVVYPPFREPAPAVAALVAHAWDREFSCGPAYIVGAKRSAHVIALYFPRQVTGASLDDYRYAPWIEPARIGQFGAVVVDIPLPQVAALFPEAPAPMGEGAVNLPYRRALSSKERTYTYSFIPPRACPHR